MKTESVIDMPKSEGLCPEVWEKVLSDDGMSSTWQLNDAAYEAIVKVIQHLDKMLDLEVFQARITGSITSNTYTENADIDLHFVAPSFIGRYQSPDEANAALRDAFAVCPVQSIGTHPIEVYCQPNPYQDYMSVGCYDVLASHWEVGPELKPMEFNPYAEYYKEIQVASEQLAKDVRNVILAAYERAVVCKKIRGSTDISTFDQRFAGLVIEMEKATKLFDAIRKMRKVFSSPTSKEQALQMRESRKWKIADAAFKLFDKYGYLAILKDLKGYNLLVCNDKLLTPRVEIVDAVIDSVKHNLANPEKLADAEDEEQLDEGVGKAIKAGAMALLLAFPGIVSAKQIQTARATTPTYSAALKKIDLSSAKIGEYTEFQIANIIARTLYAEAREDGLDGYKHVATVIYNRAKGNKADFVNVIKKHLQFSCWNKMTAEEWSPTKFEERAPASAAKNAKNEKLWKYAKEYATSMVIGTFKPASKANHYYNPAKASPSWGPKLKNVKTVGSHKFGYLKDHGSFK